MKITKIFFFGLCCLATSITLHAQLLTQPMQEIAEPDSVVAVTAGAYDLARVAPQDVPVAGTFWEFYPNGLAAPLPCPPLDITLPIYAVTEKVFIVDATFGQVSLRRGLAVTSQNIAAAVAAQGNVLADLIEQTQETEFELAVMASFGMEFEAEADFGGMNSPMYLVNDPDGLWLEITNVSSGTVRALLHNGTNEVYAIWGTTNLAPQPTDWRVQAELWPQGTNPLPFTVAQAGRDNLFLKAQDWTDWDSNADGVPDWWAWKWFGALDVAMTNLDYSGSGLTFAEDYSNNIPPTVFKYIGLEISNNYVSTATSTVQLDTLGNPYYIAVLVDDDNFSNAVWSAYSGSTVTVNLGVAQGWHEAWIGLRGYGEEPDLAVWQWKRIKLDTAPPSIVISSPTNGTVDIPMIQLQGYSVEGLRNLSFDFTNAAVSLTNQEVYVLDRHFDSVNWEYDTNFFQAFDLELTNGVNTFVLHATDLAGNVTTLATNFTLDYSAKTNPPIVQVFWPTNGAEISGTNYTLNGQLNDPTAIVVALLLDGNGGTNKINGLVERNGRFWVEEIPINSGTNNLILIVTDAVGNTTTTNISFIQSDITLTMNPVTPDSQLWQPTVNLTGAISEASYAVWVNGVKGTNYGDGTWSASNVPVNQGGTASFTLTGYAPNEQQPDGSFGN